MKKSLLFLAFGLSSVLLANSCQYIVGSSSLEWTAFKTPEKIGVKGTFDNMKITSKPSNSPEKLLASSTAHIVTATINTKNKPRDAKLVNNFFKIQGVKTIDAKVLKTNNTSAEVQLTMNNVSKVVTMSYNTTENVMTLKGSIDLADFNMLSSLEALTKACYEQHQGKTWQEVALELTINIDCK
jgi:hypothetical protein